MATVAKSKRRGPSIVALAFAGLRQQEAQEAKAAKKRSAEDPPAPAKKASAKKGGRK